ncbi:hypothetical protein Ahia01_000068800 [Argonauta hians]
MKPKKRETHSFKTLCISLNRQLTNRAKESIDMHPDLSSHLHTGECNIIIEALKICHKENPWKKFLGACNELDHSLNKCLRNERETNRRNNADKVKKDPN